MFLAQEQEHKYAVEEPNLQQQARTRSQHHHAAGRTEDIWLLVVTSFCHDATKRRHE
jgi:hypothetical protein